MTGELYTPTQLDRLNDQLNTGHDLSTEHVVKLVTGYSMLLAERYDPANFTPRRLPKEELDAAFEEGHRRAEKLRAQTAGMTKRVDYKARCKELEAELAALKGVRCS